MSRFSIGCAIANSSLVGEWSREVEVDSASLRCWALLVCVCVCDCWLLLVLIAVVRAASRSSVFSATEAYPPCTLTCAAKGQTGRSGALDLASVSRLDMLTLSARLPAAAEQASGP